jgi:hypothetical protein
MAVYYTLDDAGEPVATRDVLAWARWMEKAERHVARDDVGFDVFVSTVFLGLDHSWGSGRPLLWETMIFGGPEDGYQCRYSSRADAVTGHAAAVVIARMAPP